MRDYGLVIIQKNVQVLDVRSKDGVTFWDFLAKNNLTPRLYFLVSETMARKNPETDMLEIRVVVEPSDVDKLARGEILQLGILSFGEPLAITLQKRPSRKSEKSKVAATTLLT